MTQWEPTWAPDELTKGGYRRRIYRYTREIRSDIAYPFFIFRKDDNALMGGCTLSNVRRGVTQSASLGYWIGAQFARQGYMHAAVMALAPFVFQTLGLHRLEAACIPGNDPSQRLLLKCGFKEEGRARLFADQRQVAGPFSLLCSTTTRDRFYLRRSCSKLADRKRRGGFRKSV